MNAAGQFVVLWAANSSAQFKAAFYDQNGTFLAQGTVGSTVAGMARRFASMPCR